MTDPRTQLTITALTADGWIALFDEADAAAGVVRVDTRSPATMRQIVDVIQEHDVGWRDESMDYVACARAVLAALTEGEQ